MSALDVGSIIKGTYRVEGRLGKGGFAQVYRATHVSLQTALAIKVLQLDDPSHLDPRLNLRERFLQEARVAAAIDHPNVCKVYDCGELPDGRPYLVMAFLDGNDLDQELNELTKLPAERAVKLALQILEGLEAAHARGIVHKDLKPSNVFLVHPATPQERAVIVDFGIARAVDGTVYTAAKQVTGTPRYMAPEYAAHQVVSPAIDVYQVGLLLAEMLTGLYPVDDGSHFEQMKAHIDGRLNFPEALFEGALGEVLRGALRRDPKARHASATVFKEALKQAWSPAPPVSKRPPKGNTQRVQEPPPLWADPARVRALVEQGEWAALREATSDPRAGADPSGAALVGEALGRVHLARAVKLLEPVECAASAEHRAARWEVLGQARAGLRDLVGAGSDPQRTLAAWLNLQRDPLAASRARALQELLAADDGFAPAWRELADEQLRRGDVGGALVALDRALQLRPQDLGWLQLWRWAWDHLAAARAPEAVRAPEVVRAPEPAAVPRVSGRRGPGSLNPTVLGVPELGAQDPTHFINAEAFAALDRAEGQGRAPTVAQSPAQTLEALLKAILDKGSLLDLARQGEQLLDKPMDADLGAQAVRALYCARAHVGLARQALLWARERGPRPRAEFLGWLAEVLAP